MANEHKFKVGDYINFIGNKTNNGRIDYINENGYLLEDGTFIHFDNEHLWEKFERLQIFRNTDGNITCIKCGWIAVDIPAGIIPSIAPDVEIVGFSDRDIFGKPVSYWDIAFHGCPAFIHIFRWDFNKGIGKSFLPFFFEFDPI